MARRLCSAALVVAFALVASLSAGFADPVQAQLPPARFFGTLTIDGVPAPAGTEIKAFIRDAECGMAITTEEGRYVIDVKTMAEDAPGCGADGERVRFVVAGREAAQTGEFQIGYFINLDLTVEGAPPPPAEDRPAEQPPAEEPPTGEAPME